MSDEDQELHAEYDELENYIEALHKEQISQPPRELAPELHPIARVFSLFRSITTQHVEPDPDFVDDLRQQLRTQLEQHTEIYASRHEQQALLTRDFAAQRTNLSRRSFLTNGAVAAASFTVGAVLSADVVHKQNEELAENQIQRTSHQDYYTTQVVPDTVPSRWERVANLNEVGAGAVRFETHAFAGYVVLRDQDDGAEKTGEVVAVMATCPHMGCLVQWDSDERCFACPCHGGLFSKYGEPMQGPVMYLTALPRLETRIQDNQIYVKVPRSGATT
ncbi:ubiquinol-cytochrome c reductase iron-sulfur subunit [Ktedonospora formicarum]|uniref:Rieske domain-containing protein n=1 Tax=Ktedonospora formicarum TaxID=2778364 RepID=A0A8J3HTZ1_9CHLR|nr:Rieske 2Fe-2S domain-containing protein [Ktedonospora formicarum]GHO43952.1 hypothetical protein KSX_21150 [Ktedonospora formicarum]